MIATDKPAAPELSPADQARLEDSMREHGWLEWFPVLVALDGRVIDGHARLRAARALGIDPRATTVVGLSEEDEDELRWAANVARRHLTIEQKRELVRERLRRRPDLSNRQVAAEVGLSDKTAGSVRAELEATAEIPRTRRAHQRPDRIKPGEPDDDDMGAHDKGLAYDPDHLASCVAHITIMLPVASEEERQRGQLPYRRESDMMPWRGGRFVLASKAPTTKQEIVSLWAEIARRGIREMISRPPISMPQPDVD